MKNPTLQQVLLSIDLLQLIAFTVFIFYLILDLKQLTSFLSFQKRLKLEELSIAREEYNKKEIKIEKCARCFIVVIVVTQLVFTVAVFILMHLTQSVYTNIKLYNWTAFVYHAHQFIILIVLLLLYTFYTLKMLIVMLRKHNLAFRIHSPR